MAPMSYDSAMYLSIFGGAAMIDDFDFESSVGPSGTVSFDTGYSVDAALGFNPAAACRSKARSVT